MTSKREVERLELRAMQREKERERRRLRDRQRRQNMSQEQRERHLARRRRNYQLRRIRAQNAKELGPQQANTNIEIKEDDHKTVKSRSPSLPQLEMPTSSTSQDTREAEQMKNFPRRLRLSDVRHLARRLHSDGQQQTWGDIAGQDSTIISCVSLRRLRLVHVKRLARSLKVGAKKD